MIYRDGMNPRIEKWKQELHLKGDVYVIDNFIESLESHRKLFPNSTANTIEEAQHERILFLKAEEERRVKEAAEKAEQGEPIEEEKPKGRKKK